MNFSLRYIKSRDGVWGNSIPGNSSRWNGMVAMLMDGAADICTTTLSYRYSAMIQDVPL